MLKNIKNFTKFSKLFGIYNHFEMGLLVFGGVIMSLMEFVGLSAVFPLMVIIVQPANAPQSHTITLLYKFFHADNVEQLAMVLGFCIACLFILKNFMQAAYWRYEFRLLAKWRINIITRLYSIYMNSSYELFMQRNSSTVLNLIVGVVPTVLTNFIHPMLNLVNYMLTGILVLGYIVHVNWQVSVTIFLFGLIFLKVYGVVIKSRSKKLGEEVVKYGQQQYRLLQQSFTGYKETRGHVKEFFFSHRFLEAANRLAVKEQKLFFLANLPPVIVELVVMVMLIIVFEVIVYTGSDFRAASAQIGVMVLASLRMIPVINRSLNSIVTINSAQGPLHTLFSEAELFGIDETTFAKHLAADPNEESISPLPFAKELKLQALTYAYPKADKSTITDINFSIKPGEFIGITGPSGSGKSTLINILLGFLTNFTGTYTVDDIAINEENIRNLRKVVGFVDQQIFMMDSSIAENVAFGIDKEHIDRNKVIESLKKAQLWDYISTLPEMIDTETGENGKLLSGGQRQRLAIARAFYRDLKILILDEASAALDMETEHKLFTFLETLKGELSVIMIAHRLSTLRNCDRVLFFENGRIADSGTFEELYKANDTFKNYIHYSQIEIDSSTSN